MTATESPTAGSHGAGAAGALRRFRPSPWYFALVSVALVLAGVFAYVGVERHNVTTYSSLRPSGIPANVSTSTAALMGLSPIPHSPAPAFTLTDQNGRTMSLSSFRNHAVVLEFMDPHCVDVCPIVSQEFVDAYHDLGKEAKHVVFLAINVNQYYASVANMATFSRQHGLDAIPSWHFFTGPVSTLRKLWKAYGIEVSAPNPNADIVHTSIIYFIGRNGLERYNASPLVDHTKAGKAFLPAPTMQTWGEGIARVARDTLRA
jgi:cytochrome oxidase Cu insertion factor (SCO1/SenC/PrrC family)